MERSASRDSRGRVCVCLTEVTPDERRLIRNLVERFEGATRHGNHTVCDWVRTAISASSGTLDWKAIERLSVWCDTNMGPPAVVECARKLCDNLFGAVPERLRETGRTKRVTGYKDRTGDFVTAVNGGIR